MSELSPEATVAGEAAASAVEELHSREAVAEAALEAAETAVVAESIAEDARDASTLALAAVAEVAESQVQEERVADAEASAEQALSSGDRALQEIEAFRTQMEPIAEYFARLEAERVAAESTSPETVGVEKGLENGTGAAGSDGTSNGGNSGTRSSDTGPDRQPSSTASSRPRLRRGRK